MRTEVVIHPNRQSLSTAVSSYVILLAAQAIEKRKHFYVALSGGSLMEILSPQLVAESLRTAINWKGWHVFWADERCLPPTSLESNFGFANQHLFKYVNIPGNQIYFLDCSGAAWEAAEAYTLTLKQVFRPGAGRLPRFDLILLGIGEDGHIASLFPGHPLLNETQYWVAPVFNAPKPPPVRMTMTLPLINNARHILFVVSGLGKKAILSEILKPGPHRRKFPAGLVNPGRGDLKWFVDSEAVGLVRK
ncbi:MAG: 6-phosphogluconolactonase [Deltaproteobacteria bacterium]|nr:6-phosphogluconolactonase [Deltaproteobacteria bacterium]